MYRAIYPFHSASDEAVFTAGHKHLRELLMTSVPVVTTDGAYLVSNGYKHIPKPAVILRLGKPTVGKSVGRVIFKWHFTDRAPQARSWTGNVMLNLARPGGLVLPKPARKMVSMAFAKASQDQVDADIDLLIRAADGALRTYMDSAELDPRTVEAIAQNRPLIGPVLKAAILECRAANQDKVSKSTSEETAIADSINALPDGTPLIFRQRIHGGTWQLGVKRGKIAPQRAANVAIATPEILRGEDLKAAGLSNHQVLRHEARALKALADHPGAAFFQKGHPTIQAYSTLHDTKPFHDSFHDPDRLKAARNGPKIWMQTSWSTSASHKFRQGQFDPKNPVSRYEAEARWGPSFPRHRDAPRHAIRRITNTYHRTPAFLAPEDFSLVASLWCVSAKAASILNEHNIPGVTFRRLQVFQDDNLTSVPGEWYHMIMGAPSRHVHMESLSPALVRSLIGRTVHPYEIAVDGEAAKDLDLWWDDRMPRQILFMSGALKGALSKAGIRLGLALKPCLTS